MKNGEGEVRPGNVGILNVKMEFSAEQLGIKRGKTWGAALEISSGARAGTEEGAASAAPSGAYSTVNPASPAGWSATGRPAPSSITQKEKDSPSGVSTQNSRPELSGWSAQGLGTGSPALTI